MAARKKPPKSPTETPSKPQTDPSEHASQSVAATWLTPARILIGSAVVAVLLLLGFLFVAGRWTPSFSEMGELAYVYGHYDRAAALLTVAQKSAPNSTGINARLGCSLVQLGRYEEALPYLDRAAKHADRLGQTSRLAVDLQAARGLALVELGRGQEAVEPLKLALRTNPKHPMANYAMGRHLLENEQLVEAETYLRRLGPDPQYEEIQEELRRRIEASILEPTPPAPESPPEPEASEAPAEP